MADDTFLGESAMETVTLPLDDVTYEIVVSKRGRDFVATWKCLDCGDAGGETAIDFLSPEGALSAAKAILFSQHHSRAHGIGAAKS
jgi:hypothetical protein